MPGATTTAARCWEDVAEGDVLPGFDIYLSETKIAQQVSGSQDFYPVHHDREFARAGGHKDIFVNTGFTRALLSRLLTDYAGAEGWVRKLSYQMRRMNLPGDTMRVRGKVTGKFVAEDGAHCADIELWIENDRDGVTTPATATVSLQSRP